MTSRLQKLELVGWREWVGLPDLSVDAVKAKIDTGARSSALHAFNMERFDRGGAAMVRFELHPLQRVAQPRIVVEAAIHDTRPVRNSGGTVEERIVIRTPIRLGDVEWKIDVTLTRRDAMGFRMLLGREAIRGKFLVDAGKSYYFGQMPATIGDQDVEDDDV